MDLRASFEYSTNCSGGFEHGYHQFYCCVGFVVRGLWQVVGLIDAVVEEAAAFLSATSATLYILDRENGILWARRRGLPGTPDAGALQVSLDLLSDNGERLYPLFVAYYYGECCRCRCFCVTFAA